MITYRLGYDITTDLHHGFTLVWGRKRKRLLAFHWNWPRLIWYNNYWSLDEPGMLRGLPIARKTKKKWMLRGIYWPMRMPNRAWYWEYKVLSNVSRET